MHSKDQAQTNGTLEWPSAAACQLDTPQLQPTSTTHPPGASVQRDSGTTAALLQHSIEQRRRSGKCYSSACWENATVQSLKGAKEGSGADSGWEGRGTRGAQQGEGPRTNQGYRGVVRGIVQQAGQGPRAPTERSKCNTANRLIDVELRPAGQRSARHPPQPLLPLPMAQASARQPCVAGRQRCSHASLSIISCTAASRLPADALADAAAAADAAAGNARPVDYRNVIARNWGGSLRPVQRRACRCGG